MILLDEDKNLELENSEDKESENASLTSPVSVDEEKLLEQLIAEEEAKKAEEERKKAEEEELLAQLIAEEEAEKVKKEAESVLDNGDGSSFEQNEASENNKIMNDNDSIEDANPSLDKSDDVINSAGDDALNFENSVEAAEEEPNSQNNNEFLENAPEQEVEENDISNEESSFDGDNQENISEIDAGDFENPNNYFDDAISTQDSESSEYEIADENSEEKTENESFEEEISSDDNKSEFDSKKDDVLADDVAESPVTDDFLKEDSLANDYSDNQEISEEEQLLEQKRLEDEKNAEEKRLEDERIAEEKRMAEEKRLEEEKIAEEKRLEEERIAEEQRQAEILKKKNDIINQILDAKAQKRQSRKDEIEAKAASFFALFDNNEKLDLNEAVEKENDISTNDLDGLKHKDLEEKENVVANIFEGEVDSDISDIIKESEKVQPIELNELSNSEETHVPSFDKEDTTEEEARLALERTTAEKQNYISQVRFDSKRYRNSYVENVEDFVTFSEKESDVAFNNVPNYLKKWLFVVIYAVLIIGFVVTLYLGIVKYNVFSKDSVTLSSYLTAETFVLCILILILVMRIMNMKGSRINNRGRYVRKERVLTISKPDHEFRLVNVLSTELASMDEHGNVSEPVDATITIMPSEIEESNASNDIIDEKNGDADFLQEEFEELEPEQEKEVLIFNNPNGTTSESFTTLPEIKEAARKLLLSKGYKCDYLNEFIAALVASRLIFVRNQSSFEELTIASEITGSEKFVIKDFDGSKSILDDVDFRKAIEYASYYVETPVFVYMKNFNLKASKFLMPILNYIKNPEERFCISAPKRGKKVYLPNNLFIICEINEDSNIWNIENELLQFASFTTLKLDEKENEENVTFEPISISHKNIAKYVLNEKLMKYLNEISFKKFDEFVNKLSRINGYYFDNRIMIRFENHLSVLITLDEEGLEDICLDNSIYNFFLPYAISLEKPETYVDVNSIDAFFDSNFGEDKMISTRKLVKLYERYCGENASAEEEISEEKDDTTSSNEEQPTDSNLIPEEEQPVNNLNDSENMEVEASEEHIENELNDASSTADENIEEQSNQEIDSTVLSEEVSNEETNYASSESNYENLEEANEEQSIESNENISEISSDEFSSEQFDASEIIEESIDNSSENSEVLDEEVKTND